LKARGKGKQKRVHEDLSPELKNQLKCYLELQKHLECTEHSKPGAKTYCLIERSNVAERGGHREMNHQEMTLWAKQMVSRVKWNMYDKKDSPKF
jgi:hypothetical protein